MVACSKGTCDGREVIAAKMTSGWEAGAAYDAALEKHYLEEHQICPKKEELNFPKGFVTFIFRPETH